MRKRFAVCLDNTDYLASLIPGKLYETLPDEDAAKDDFIRVIDESGEDYLYHQSRFTLAEPGTDSSPDSAKPACNKKRIATTN